MFSFLLFVTSVNVQCAFEETEGALLMLEDMVETQELREKQLDHRFQLALYQEKRASELQDLKERLTEEHLRKIAEYDKQRESHLKERQAVFQEAFEEDLQRFKSQGALPRSKTSGTDKSTPSLEEIVLDEDSVDLESFLADQNQEDGGDIHKKTEVKDAKEVGDDNASTNSETTGKSNSIKVLSTNDDDVG
ncbi:Dysbindin protein [Orchesella cincta]|uniref:Dysbindin protein n=1 Tax=Orchesella cincta TaxID=48709 RepID=A0A1D2MDM1_ORCCI|nr:Dysbindin protein [Orchesella cincta]